MKPKSKTMIERHGFKDLDLITKEHDVIVQKLLDEKFIKDFFKYIGINRILKQKKHWCKDYKTKNNDDSDCMHSCFHTGEDSGCFFNLKSKSYKNKEKINNTFNNILYQLKKENIIYNNNTMFTTKLEEPINSGNYIIGYIDCVLLFNKNNYFNLFESFYYLNKMYPLLDRLEYEEYKRIQRTGNFKIYIEVKTSISNVGETLRQINTYRNYIMGGIWVIITKTKGLKVSC